VKKWRVELGVVDLNNSVRLALEVPAGVYETRGGEASSEQEAREAFERFAAEQARLDATTLATLFAASLDAAPASPRLVLPVSLCRQPSAVRSLVIGLFDPAAPPSS
jgi:hypothetical protein